MSSRTHRLPHPRREGAVDAWTVDAAPVASLDGPRILVVGTGPALGVLADQMAKGRAAPSGVSVLGSEPPVLPTDWSFLGPISRLAEVLDGGQVDEVFLCLGQTERSNHPEVLELCRDRGIRVSVPVPFGRGADRRPGGLAATVKRGIDLVGSIVGLIILSPLLIAGGAAIAVTDGWPIMFRQPRAGQNGRPFTIAKFRTMERDADGRRDMLRAANEVSGAAFKMDADPRVTPLGQWLRRLSIDELPQLWNVLRGEMSLVGPRPHPFDDIAGYEAWHLRRLAVKPGMTGLWQLELRNDPDFDRWVAKDLEYVDGWSLWLDLKIIARTVGVVLRGSGR